MALSGSAGMTLLILACTLEKSNWWPAIVTIFYVLSPLPLLLSKHLSNDSGFGGERNPAKEWAYFLTVGIVMSTFALPILLCRISVVSTYSLAKVFVILSLTNYETNDVTNLLKRHDIITYRSVRQRQFYHYAVPSSS